MRKLTILQMVTVAMSVLLCTGMAQAFDASFFTPQSKLATGKWVKIAITDNGVYELTYDELLSMGFSNPDRVRIYGNGGFLINEKLDENDIVDDLKPVPVLRTHNKICFYGKGHTQLSLTGGNTSPRFTRVFNPYSLEGCYFLTEESGSELSVSTAEAVVPTNPVDYFTCLSYFYHENELDAVSRTGRDMLGEDIRLNKVRINFTVPDIADSSIMVNTVAAVANKSSLTYVGAVINCGNAIDTVPYSSLQSRVNKVGDYDYYFTASPYAKVKLRRLTDRGYFEPFLTFGTGSSPDLTLARLDYVILTYSRSNVVREQYDSQLLMGYGRILGNERFKLPNAASTTVVWSITNPSNPVSIPLVKYNDHQVQGYYFSAKNEMNGLFIAFDPAKKLKKITSYEPVENQNLHALQTPELLIITDKMYHEQAERVAALHRAVDGIDVAVVDQDKVFNEFSSGVRDAMGYRLLCKMLYDRNPDKFKNLLLFGHGNLDNRGITGPLAGSLLTYQTINSSNEDFSYTSDDFYGMLADKSGSNIASDKLSIGVGRMTCSTMDEAVNDVDKLVEYYANPDYGVWRNNALVFTDDSRGNKGEFTFQGEGYRNQIDNEQSTGMQVTAVHGVLYPRSSEEAYASGGISNMPATVAKDQLTHTFKSGVYFGTYVGHAGSIGFTKSIDMWNNRDVMSTSYQHLPILYTSCCNVAHFDYGRHGIAELMFHKRDGGAIALITASRMVLSGDNDALTTRFIRKMFGYHDSGKMLTLGEALRLAKLEMGYTNFNKMKFFLLGDPAIKINYPVTRFKITKVMGVDMSDSTATARLHPLQRFPVEAQVVDENGTLDKTFNGDATMTLYDKNEVFCSISNTSMGALVTRDIKTNRAKLGEVNGRVVNGIFKGSMIVPMEVKASNENVLLRVYAHQDNSSVMVNGFNDKLVMKPYYESVAVNDTQAPVIDAMYINDEATFTDGAVVGAKSMVYITARDNEAINLQSNSVTNGLNLMLDGGNTSYSDIDCYVTAGADGKSISVKYPLSDIAEGLHTLTFTVTDLKGQRASRTITFMVGQKGGATLVADKLPVYRGETVNFDVESTVKGNPEYVVRVTDAVGKLVWKTHTSTFPVAWNLTDNQGQQVPAGLYRYYGTYVDGEIYGGTPINDLIVLDPIKTAN